MGSGLAGATAAWALRDRGFLPTVLESEPTCGGQLRTAQMNGILYEPYGAHIFHTRDEQVWRIVTSLVEMLPYQHRVMTEINGRVLSWPPQLDELRQLPEWPRIDAELEARPSEPETANFETWCHGIMGATLYEWFVEPYTRKQWGVDPATLSSSWAPRRLELRDDGYRGLFRDPWQGWPAGGYLQLINVLLKDIDTSTGIEVSADNFEELTRDFDCVVVTMPLDAFFDDVLGALPWRGVRLVNRFVADVEHVLPCGVLNHPATDVGYTRRVETKWMSGQAIPGTVVSEEYPGAPARHYPIDDVGGENRALAARYRSLMREEFGPRVYLAGRLATYTYIDMDQAMRQALNVVNDIVRDCRDV